MSRWDLRISIKCSGAFVFHLQYCEILRRYYWFHALALGGIFHYISSMAAFGAQRSELFATDFRWIKSKQ